MKILLSIFSVLILSSGVWADSLNVNFMTCLPEENPEAEKISVFMSANAMEVVMTAQYLNPDLYPMDVKDAAQLLTSSGKILSGLNGVVTKEGINGFKLSKDRSSSKGDKNLTMVFSFDADADSPVLKANITLTNTPKDGEAKPETVPYVCLQAMEKTPDLEFTNDGLVSQFVKTKRIKDGVYSEGFLCQPSEKDENSEFAQMKLFLSQKALNTKKNGGEEHTTVKDGLSIVIDDGGMKALMGEADVSFVETGIQLAVWSFSMDSESMTMTLTWDPETPGKVIAVMNESGDEPDEEILECTDLTLEKK